MLSLLFTLALMLAIVPWRQGGAVDSLQERPFVQTLSILEFLAPAGVMYFVVGVTAVSAMDAQLYSATRTIFSLFRGGYATRGLGRNKIRGIPAVALFTSSPGAVLAAVVNALSPNTAFAILLAVASFGALFTWFMIFVTHLPFRRSWTNAGSSRQLVRMVGYPYLSALRALLMAAILLTTVVASEFGTALIVGVSFLFLIYMIYLARREYLPHVDSEPKERQPK